MTLLAVSLTVALVVTLRAWGTDDAYLEERIMRVERD